MKAYKLIAGLSTACGLLFTVAGCGGGRPEGDLPVSNVPISQEESDKKAAEIFKAQAGNYKGAPGAPAPKGPGG